MEFTPKRILSLYMACLQCLFILLTPGFCPAEELVSASYQASQEGKIMLRLRINEPPPSSIIVIQHFPAGVQVTSSHPPYQKLSENGEAKWLVKDPQPGELLIEVSVASPIDSNDIKCEIRYRDPTTNQMKTIKGKKG